MRQERRRKRFFTESEVPPRRLLEQDVRVRFVDSSELLIFAIGILMVVLLLFPRERLEWLIMQEEDTNLDLSVIYIENLLAVNPDDRIRLSLAKKYLRLARYDRAESILTELENSPIGYVRFEAFSLKYEMLKRKYFAGYDVRDAIEEELRKAIERTENPSMLVSLYKESLSMAMPQLALRAAEKLSKRSRIKAYWLAEAYRQALATSNFRKAIGFAETLAEVDSRRRAHWLRQAMRTAISIGQYDLAESYLVRLGNIKKDAGWYLSAAELYLNKGDYRGAIDSYVAAMKVERTKYRRFVALKQAIEVALWHEDYREVKRLIDRYGSEFLEEEDMAKFILQSALATGDALFARNIALNILTHFEENPE